MLEGINEVIDKAIDIAIDDIHTCIPGKIELYYGHAQRKARVKPLVKLRNSNSENLSILEQSLSVLPIDNVPVIFPSSSSFSLLFPLNPGDGCLIVFSEVPIGPWSNSSGVSPVDPEDEDRHSLGNAICIPGLWPFTKVPEINVPLSINPTDMFLKFGNFKLQVASEGLTFEITDGSQNTITSDSTSITINGNLQVLK